MHKIVLIIIKIEHTQDSNRINLNFVGNLDGYCIPPNRNRPLCFLYFFTLVTALRYIENFSERNEVYTFDSPRKADTSIQTLRCLLRIQTSS